MSASSAATRAGTTSLAAFLRLWVVVLVVSTSDPAHARCTGATSSNLSANDETPDVDLRPGFSSSTRIEDVPVNGPDEGTSTNLPR